MQRHLLAVPTHTLEDAVRAGDEYLQIKPVNICQIKDEEEEEVMNPTEKALIQAIKS